MVHPTGTTPNRALQPNLNATGQERASKRARLLSASSRSTSPATSPVAREQTGQIFASANRNLPARGNVAGPRAAAAPLVAGAGLDTGPIARSALSQQFRTGEASGAGLNCLIHTFVQLADGEETNDQSSQGRVGGMRARLVAAGVVPATGAIDVYGGAGETLAARFKVRFQVVSAASTAGSATVHPVIGDDLSHPLVTILHTGSDSNTGHFQPLWPKTSSSADANAAPNAEQTAPRTQGNVFAQPLTDQGDLPRPKAPKSKRTKITYAQIEALQSFKDLNEVEGLVITARSIASIVGKRYLSLKIFENVTLALKANLTSLTQIVGPGKLIPDFTSLSSILGKSGAKAGEAISALLTAFTEHEDDLTALIGPGKLIPNFKNFSSILSGAGAEAAEATLALIKVLTENLDTLNALIPDFKSLSSILHRAGSKAGEATLALIKVLTENKEDLDALIGPGKLIPNFKSFSSMLNGAGAEAAEATLALIKVLTENLDTLNALIGPGQVIPDFDQLSSELNGVGAKAAQKITDFCKGVGDITANAAPDLGAKVSGESGHSGHPSKTPTPGAATAIDDMKDLDFDEFTRGIDAVDAETAQNTRYVLNISEVPDDPEILNILGENLTAEYQRTDDEISASLRPLIADEENNDPP